MLLLVLVVRAWWEFLSFMIMAMGFRLHDDASFELHTPQPTAFEEHGLPDGYYDVIDDGWVTEWDKDSRPFVSQIQLLLHIHIHICMAKAFLCLGTEMEKLDEARV